MIQASSNQLWNLIDRETQIHRIASGFEFTEGPVWHPHDQHLLFSDIPGNRRIQYSLDGTVQEVRNPSSKCNGLTYDYNLNLLVCEHVSSSLVLEEIGGRRQVLASHFEGKQLNSPNDLCVRSDGSIYFSDPTYGRMQWSGDERTQDLNFQGVYRIHPKGDLELLVEKNCYQQPNGLCFSPDESLLYINDSPRALIDVYKVAADGSLYDKNRFAENIGCRSKDGVPDEQCDENGNIWVTGPKGHGFLTQKATFRDHANPRTYPTHWGQSWHIAEQQAPRSIRLEQGRAPYRTLMRA